MKVYKHKDNNHYYIVYKTVKDIVYYMEWDEQYIRHWRRSKRLFDMFKKRYLEPVPRLKAILIAYKVQKFGI